MKIGIYSLEGYADLGLFVVAVFHASPWSLAHTSGVRVTPGCGGLWQDRSGSGADSDGRGLVQLAAAQHGL